jgi:hypothetical protein
MNIIQRYLQKEGVIFFAVPFICLLFYSGELTIGYSRLDLKEHLNYFRLLADAFLHGRLYITGYPNDYDLIFYHNKTFLYWPPVPALVYMPLVALFGIHLPDAFINVLFGVLNVYLVMRIMQALCIEFSIPFRQVELILLGFFWGLGTVHFYMAMDGNVWLVAQIMAQTFLLASILVFLKARNKKKYLLSGLWFAMAVYTRNDLVFTLVFYIFLYIPKTKDGNVFLPVKRAMVFVFPFLVFSVFNLWYNYLRFGHALDNGINYHHMNPYFDENFKHWGYLSVHYIPHNFYIEVLRFPVILFKWPFIQNDYVGFGLFWASPFFFLLFPALAGYLLKSRELNSADVLAIIGALITVLLTACLIFMVMGTGWMQFGPRYTLDFYIFLLIAMAFMNKIFYSSRSFHITAVLLVCLSIVINYCGVYLHFHLY